jgi:uncharacterized protein (DUF433 family)
VIENTRISVRLIAGYYKAGMTVEEILRDYPHLAAAAVYDAISYYIDHQAEIEALIERTILVTRRPTPVPLTPMPTSSHTSSQPTRR